MLKPDILRCCVGNPYPSCGDWDLNTCSMISTVIILELNKFLHHHKKIMGNHPFGLLLLSGNCSRLVVHFLFLFFIFYANKIGGAFCIYNYHAAVKAKGVPLAHERNSSVPFEPGRAFWYRFC
jgi:hypothetical protein